MSHAPQEVFWIWFAQHQAELFDFETDQERLFDQLAIQLQKVQPNLTFEFGPKDGGKREFVISAGGIKAAFPAVVFLADVAPALDQWRVTAFRPRRTPINIVELEGKCVAQTMFSSPCWITEPVRASISSFPAFEKAISS